MDLNLKTLVGVSYFIPIALTLRKVYAPSFEIPEAFTAVLAKLESGRAPRRRQFMPRRQPIFTRDLVI